MDFNKFQEILLEFTSDKPHEDSSTALQNLIDSNYPLYIEFLLNGIKKVENESVFNMSILLLQTEVIKKRIFSNPNITITAIKNLTPLICNIFQSSKVQNNFKRIIASILAQLQIFSYHNSNNIDLLNYILEIYGKIPEIRKYLTYFIFKISISDEDFGGFKIDNLIQILSDTTTDESDYLPKINLFFAIATRRPDVQVLHEIFPDLISSCPNNNLDEMLLSLSDFSEHSSSFFQPYLGLLVQRLCELASDAEMTDSIRNKSMICLTSIANGATEMCQNTEDYYVPVFKTLLQVASEINDESPWEYDINNTCPYQIALNSISFLYTIFNNNQILDHIIDMIMTILSDDDISWEAVYACINALPSINSLIYLSMEDDRKKNVFEKVASFMKIECHPRERISAYTFIYKLSHNKIFAMPEFELNSILIEPLESAMIIENNPIAKKVALQAYAEFLTMHLFVIPKESIYFHRCFSNLVKELANPQPDLIAYILHIIGPLFYLAKEESAPQIAILIKVANGFINNKDHNVQAESVYCFALSIATFQASKLIKLIYGYIERGFQLLHSRDLNNMSLKSLYKGMHLLLCHKGVSVGPFVVKYIPMIFNDCQKMIKIEETNSLESNDEKFKNKEVYLKISPSNSPIIQYVLVNEAKTIKNSMKILRSLIFGDQNFREHLDQIYRIARIWLTNEFNIENISKECWKILDLLIEKIHFFNDKEKESSNLLLSNNFEFIFNCFIRNIKHVESPVLMNEMLDTLCKSVSSAISSNLKWSNPELFESLFKTIHSLTGEIVTNIDNIVKEMKKFDSLDLNAKIISDYNHCLNNISTLISYFYEYQPEKTDELYVNLYAPNINKYLENDATIEFGIKLTSSYIIYHKDMNQTLEFCENLIKNVENLAEEEIDDNDIDDPRVDLAMESLYTLGNILLNVPLQSEDVAQHFMGLLMNLFFNNNLVNNIRLISDYANVALAKFLITNKNLLQPDVVVNNFIEALPLSGFSQDCDYHYSCMADLLELGYFQMVCGDDWVETLVPSIINGYINQAFNKNIETRFKNFLKRYYDTPAGKNSIDMVLPRINHQRYEAFFKLINE